MTELANFNSKLLPMAQQHDAMVVSTDCEPDDFLALKVVAKIQKERERLSNPLPLLIVVGEGKDVDKTSMMRDCAESLGLKCTVVQGKQSSRDYPAGMLTAFGPISFPSAAPTISDPARIVAAAECVETVRAFLANYQHPLYLMLKPCWELIGLDAALLAKTTLALYGGFNLRCMYEKGQTREWVAEFINKSFCRVVFYESYYATGSENSLSVTEAPHLFKAIATQHSRFWLGVQRCMDAWNDSNSLVQVKRVATTGKRWLETWAVESATATDDTWKRRKTDLENIEASVKILKANVEARNKQVVFADFGLLVALVNYGKAAVDEAQVIQCSISFNDDGRGKTSLNADPLGKVFAIKGLPRAKFVQAVEAALLE